MRLLFFVSTLLVASTASAQVVTRVDAPAGTSGIRASEYVARVLDASPTVAEARALATAYEAGIDEARVLPSPYVRGGFNTVDISGASAPTETFVAIGMPIDYAGAVGTRIDAAFAGHEAAQARIAAAEREARTEALERFVAALAARARALTIAGRVRLAADIASAVGRRAELGEATSIESALARFVLSTERAELVRLEGAAEAARVAMAALAGDTSLAPIGDLAVPPRDADEAALLESALATRPDVLATRLDVTTLERDRDVRHRSRWPDLVAEVGWVHSFASLDSLFNQPEYDALMLSLQIELPFALAWDGELRRADAELEAADAAVLGAELRIRVEVSEAAAEYGAARASLVALTGGPLPEATELERLVATAFERGESDVLALLAAREHLRELDLLVIDALAEHARALAALLVATGSDEIPF